MLPPLRASAPLLPIPPSAFRGLAMAALAWFCACARTAAYAEVAEGQLQIVVDKALPPGAQSALGELRRAATAHAHGHPGRVVVVDRAPADVEAALTLVVGIAGQSPETDRILAAEKVPLPEAPESLAVRHFGDGRKSLLVCGRDARGLSYALRDVARSIELAPREADPLAHVVEEVAAPQLAVRNVSIHPLNADVERGWYFDEAFWRSYFAMLALSRFNQFTLTFSDQTNYLCPVYAFLVDMPGYPEVKVTDRVRKERTKQLAMLKRIAELAEADGIDFNLGIWMQAPVPKYPGAVEVTGLPEGAELSRYCALGLRRVLEACPSIRGVQLRMNAESGVPEDKQAEFFHPIFQSLRAASRPIRLDLRFKGLQPATTQAAIDEKLDVTVSTKYWSEHFGLPYHPTSVDTHWSKDRYGFGALLKEPRAYRVTYQLWNAGSQRLTLWGDTDYARRFAESCKLGGGDGFEVFAPLTNQGYGNQPGEWRALRDPEYRVGKWEQERYWYFYLCLGRMGFNKDTDPEVWRREFRLRFGGAAQPIERACRAASAVLPMITAARLPGASEWTWWPEMDSGGKLREYIRIQPSDPAQFYAISQWEKTPEWRWEEWDATPGFVEDATAGRVTGKWTPWMIADRLDRIAADIETQWTAAATAKAATPEWRMTEVDHRLLAELAHYHAAKTRAATELAFFEIDKQGGRIKVAEAHAMAARDAWKRLVALTAPAYHSDLVFGITQDSPRSKFGNHHAGHWQDRLAEVEEDVQDLRDLRQKLEAEAGGALTPVRRLPAEEPAARPRFQVNGTTAQWRPDGGVDIRVTIAPDSLLKQVVLHHRPLDQTCPWQLMAMRSVEAGVYETTVPADQIDPHFEWQYFVELLGAHGGMMWPAWEERQPYEVLRPPAR